MTRPPTRLVVPWDTKLPFDICTLSSSVTQTQTRLRAKTAQFGKIYIVNHTSVTANFASPQFAGEHKRNRRQIHRIWAWSIRRLCFTSHIHNTHMYIYMCLYVYTCMIYIYIYIYIYIHIIHIHVPLSREQYHEEKNYKCPIKNGSLAGKGILLTLYRYQVICRLYYFLIVFTLVW